MRNQRDADPGGHGLVEDLGRFPVTAVTLMASIIASVAYWKHYPVGPIFMTSDAFLTQPWRLVTSALPHADWIHLLFNAYWTWQFGRWVENGFGSLRALGLGLALAAGSSAAQFAFDGPGIGMSGVGYGLFGLLWALGRHDPAFRGAVDLRTTRLFIGWFFLCILLTLGGAWNVANVAHGSGAVLGFLFGKALRVRRQDAAVWRAALFAVFAGVWTLGAFARPWVNFGSDMSRELFARGYAAHESRDFERAAKLYREVLARDGESSAAAFNLGQVLGQLGRHEESLEAFEQAIAIDPYDLDSHLRCASVLSRLGRYEESLEIFEEALRIDPDNADARAGVDWTKNKIGRRD